MTDVAVPAVGQDAPRARPGRRFSWAWLGLVPFLAFAAAFLIIPTFYLVTGSFRTESGQPTLQNYADLSQPDHRRGVPGQHRDQRGDRRSSAGSSASCSRTPSSGAGCRASSARR